MFSSMGIAQNSSSIEGKWVSENYPNTMYILEGGLRYTYYCLSANCDSLYSTFEAADGNNLPEVNDYTFNNDSLSIDLNFGNYFISKVEFQCEGNIVDFIDSESTNRWIRVGTNINDCLSSLVNEKEQNNLPKIYPNPSEGFLNLSFEKNYNGKIIVTDILGKAVYGDQMKGTEKRINLSNLSSGIYTVMMESELGYISQKIVIE